MRGIDKPFVIGVCGGSASGKTTACEQIAEHLAGSDVRIISADSFYKSLTSSEIEQAMRGEFNFDSPDHMDFEGLKNCLRKLRKYEDCEIPVYDFCTFSRKSDAVVFPKSHVIVVEGVLLFTDPELRSMLDMKVFVDCEADLRLARRVRRDMRERDSDLDGVFTVYFKFVQPTYDALVEPSKRYADVIIPNTNQAGVNPVAIDLISKHISTQLALRSIDE